MSLLSPSPSMKPTDVGTSAAQNTSVGSGSRPTPSKVKIATSAPTDPHGLGRMSPGALK